MLQFFMRYVLLVNHSGIWVLYPELQILLPVFILYFSLHINHLINNKLKCFMIFIQISCEIMQL